MKKKTAVLLCAFVFCQALYGCGADNSGTREVSDSEESAQEAAEETDDGGSSDESGAFVMKIGHAQSEASPRHRSLLKFKEDVERDTDGGITVEIYPDGQLGDETEMTVSVSDGSLEAVRGGDLEFVPKTTMLGLPMIADTIEEARELCYSDFVADMLSSSEDDYNMKVLAVGDDSGFRQITNNVHEIRKPSDMKGLKMRTVLQVIDMSLTEFGASTEMIPFTELYDALESGRVDGQENPLALIDSNRFYEVQKYCTIIDYMFFPELMYVNLDWWNSLPEDYRTVLEKDARLMMDENARITDEENASYMKHIAENGCQIYTLTKAERDAFKPLAQNVWEDYIDEGRISEDELNKMLAVIGKSVTW